MCSPWQQNHLNLKLLYSAHGAMYSPEQQRALWNRSNNVEAHTVLLLQNFLNRISDTYKKTETVGNLEIWLLNLLMFAASWKRYCSLLWLRLFFQSESKICTIMFLPPCRELLIAVSSDYRGGGVIKSVFLWGRWAESLLSPCKHSPCLRYFLFPNIQLQFCNLIFKSVALLNV